MRSCAYWFTSNIPRARFTLFGLIGTWSIPRTSCPKCSFESPDGTETAFTGLKTRSTMSVIYVQAASWPTFGEKMPARPDVKMVSERHRCCWHDTVCTNMTNTKRMQIRWMGFIYGRSGSKACCFLFKTWPTTLRIMQTWITFNWVMPMLICLQVLSSIVVNQPASYPMIQPLSTIAWNYP